MQWIILECGRISLIKPIHKKFSGNLSVTFGELFEIFFINNTYSLPIFSKVFLLKSCFLSKKELRFGYVKDHNDQQKTVLIEFVKDKKLILSSKFNEITEANENEDDLPLFDKNRKNDKGYSKRRENNQPKFRSDVFKYYIKNNEWR